MSKIPMVAHSESYRERSDTRVLRWLAHHWLIVFLVGYGVFNLLPFLAPVFMRLGWQGVGNGIYDMYSLLCHQMAQRSFFLFGPKVMYSPGELPLELTGTDADMMLLRHFRGSDLLGWKVAWSDRMVSMYGGVWLAALLYHLIARLRPVKPLRLWALGLLLLPMVLDGGTHMISDTFGGLLDGFRYHNRWLADLTGNALPASFYIGDGWGSFNSWMRLLTGLLFGLGVVWFAFPYIDRQAQQTVEQFDDQTRRLIWARELLQAELERLEKRRA